MPDIPDIDIDLQNREDLLNLLEYIPASMYRKGELAKHNVGVYLQEIPVDPISGLCSIPYKEAEERGYFKFDFLNVHLYSGLRNEEHLLKLLDKEPIWDMLLDEEISSQLFQLNGHANILKSMRPSSVEQLAMVIAMIRPGKRYLVGKDWATVEKEIWLPTEDGEYVFKKSHSFSYALAIVVQMNLIVERTLTDD